MFSTCTQVTDCSREKRQGKKKGEEILPQCKEKVDAQINIKHISNQHQLEICFPNDEDDVFDVYVQQKPDRMTVKAEIFPVNPHKSCCLSIWT